MDQRPTPAVGTVRSRTVRPIPFILRPAPPTKPTVEGAITSAKEAIEDAASLIAAIPGSLVKSAKFYRSHPSQLKVEILSGLTLATMGVSQAIAYALLGGFSPTAGLYGSALLPIVVGALSGRPASITATAGATAAIIKDLTSDSGPLAHVTLQMRQEFLAPVLLLAAGIQFILGISGAAKFMRLIPHTALQGFLNGLAIIITMSQFDVWRYCPSGHFDECKKGDLAWLPLDSLECWLTTIHVLVAMALMFLVPKIPKLGKILPGSFCALVSGLVLEEAIYRAAGGVRTRNVSETTILVRHLPTWHSPTLPPGTTGDIGVLVQYAVTISAICLIESVLTVRLMCTMLGEEMTHFAGNMECVAQAAGNLICSFFGAMGGGGLVGESMLNIINGARGRLSSITFGVVMLLIIGVAGPLIELVPIASLGGILFAMCINIFNWESLKLLTTTPFTMDWIIVVVVSALGASWNLAFAVLIGCGLAALGFAFQSNHLLRVEVECSHGQVDQKPIAQSVKDISSPSPLIRVPTHQHDAIELVAPLSSPIPLPTPSPSLDDSTIPIVAQVAPSHNHKTYRIIGLLCFSNVSEFTQVFPRHIADEPDLIVLDFIQCRLMDYSAFKSVKELINSHQKVGKRITERGFDDAAREIGDWKRLMGSVQFDEIPIDLRESDSTAEDSTDEVLLPVESDDISVVHIHEESRSDIPEVNNSN